MLLYDLFHCSELNVTFVIIVFAWKRRMSLKRLCDSLLAAEYHGIPVQLEFHIDGEAHERVLQYVDEFSWPFGSVQVLRQADRIGLESIVVGSWPADSDDQYAMFFEDDIEVSPHYFTYTLLALRKYLFGDGGRTGRTYHAEHLAGISYNTPRYNEINLPPHDWVPQMVIGREAQFLFQLPCSWGALYFPWIWREFLEYYRWRKTITLPPSYVVVPLSATNEWTNSWKRYLVELMYARGLYMLYPSLPRQQSFSTHHREPGEHTDAVPEEHLVDELGTLVLDYFTVPLAKDADMVNQHLFSQMRPLKDLPVVSFHHEAEPDVYRLAQLGAWSVEMLRPYPGYQFKHDNGQCILDMVSYPVRAADKKASTRYLLYEPQLYISHQIGALENALAYAQILNRTLIVPPLVLPGQNEEVPMDTILDLRLFDGVQADGPPWSLVKQWGKISSPDSIWVDRVVWFRPWNVPYLFSLPLQDHFLSNHTIAPLRSVMLPVIRGSDVDVARLFGGCQDEYLTFRSMLGAFYAYQDPLVDGSFRNWTQSHLVPTWTLREFMAKLWAKQLKRPIGVVAFSRGKDPATCGVNQKDFLEVKGDLIAYRNCKATIPRTLEYLIEYAKGRKEQLATIYLTIDPDLEDSGMLSEPIPLVFSTIPVYSTARLREALGEEKAVRPQLQEYIADVAAMLELEIAVEADLYLGNFYWDTSKRVIKKRRLVAGRPSQVIALGEVNVSEMEQKQRIDQ